MEPYAVQTNLGWSVVGSFDIEGEHRVCHRVSVKELPSCTPKDLVSVFERDFQDTSGYTNLHVSQEDIKFLNILDETIVQRVAWGL